MDDPLTQAKHAVVKLGSLLEDPDPGFICANPFGDRTAKYVARVHHVAGDPASRDDLLWLKEMLGPAYKPFAFLYILHDGMRLFVPTIARIKDEKVEDGGFEYIPLNQMRQSEQVIGQMLCDAIPDEELPEDAGELLAFVGVPMSGNLICIRTSGERRGELAELNHDCPPGGFGHPKVLADLLNLVRVGPEVFFVSAGGYTFYSDGQTEAQWRPLRYVADCRQLTADQIQSEPLPDWFPE